MKLWMDDFIFFPAVICFTFYNKKEKLFDNNHSKDGFVCD